nr:RHS repeat-associated core domain-containing protein [Treponema sp. OMZ 799]
MAFENRWSRYKEIGKKVPQAYRVYVEHLFLRSDAGDARIFSKEMTHADNNGDTTEQTEKRYYYHADHLQSAQFITNARGEQYEHIEYTPYGELWIEETAPGIDKLPFRFTGKELDEETGLYYYEARYLDPKYSRWLSGDPALNDYIPKVPINDEAKKHNGNLPGMGGIYNTVNLHVYHYAGNNPIKYIDPDGRILIIDGSSSDDPNYVKKIEKLLDLASSASAEFKDMLDAIRENKEITVTIKDFNEEFKIPVCGIMNKKNFLLDYPSDSTIYLSPEFTYSEKSTGDNFSALEIIAHELTHAYDNMRGMYYKNSYIPVNGGKSRFNRKKELNAVNIENQIRLFFGKSHRNTYSSYDIGIRTYEKTKKRVEMWSKIR